MPTVKTPIRRKIRTSRPEKIRKTVEIAEFYEKRNKLLIFRGCGGLGDILMHRMIFEDFKRLSPDIEIHFACPKEYHDAVKDHPYIDLVLDTNTVNRMDYIVSYNTTTACGRYEMKLAPHSDKHRSDIWANYCGLELQNHNMHIQLTEEEKSEGSRILEKHQDRTGPIVTLAPISAMVNKNLTDDQTLGVVQELQKQNYCVIGLHKHPIPVMFKHNIPCMYGLNLRQWMGVIHQSDYVISVDTSTFHCAGGMGRPLVGIFTFVDGLVYGKYYPNFELVQKHRKLDPEWTCGPCYNWGACPKTKNNPKPCLTQITVDMILEGFEKIVNMNNK